MIFIRTFLSISISTFFYSGVVHSWGKLGHEIVANMAWSRLTTPTKRWINEILNQEVSSFQKSSSGSPLAYVSNWADIVRYTHDYHWSAPLHFVDICDDEIVQGCPIVDPESYEWKTDCHFLYERDCIQDICVTGAIRNYSFRLLTSSQQISCAKSSLVMRRSQYDNQELAGLSQLESLKFLTHFLGDIHQPLHVSRKTDRGGNAIAVHFDSLFKNSNKGILNQTKSTTKIWNLHAVWDDGIIEKAISDLFHRSRKKMEENLMQQLELYITNGELTLWLLCGDGRKQECTKQWTEESLQYALSWAYRNEHGNAIQEGDNISDEYYQTRLPIIQRRLVAAGVRLAKTLELIQSVS
jgi:hypothetical protein